MKGLLYVTTCKFWGLGLRLRVEGLGMEGLVLLISVLKAQGLGLRLWVSGLEGL